MTAEELLNVGKFIAGIEELEATHGLFLKSDRMVQISSDPGLSAKPRLLATVSLNGRKAHRVWS